MSTAPMQSAGWRVVETTWDENQCLQPSVPIDELTRAIEQDAELIILRGAWTEEEILGFRKAILDWGRSTPAWPNGVSASVPGINFHRVDDGRIPGKMAHIFHQFGLGNLDALDEPLRSWVDGVARPMFELQNRLAGTSFPFESPDFRIKAIRHPRGGGYLVPHVHPYIPQKVAIFLNLSEPGIDYASGGAWFWGKDRKKIDTYETFRRGDLLAWRYDMPHQTAPIDPGEAVDWESDDGMWIFAMEWVEAHGLTNQTETNDGR